MGKLSEIGRVFYGIAMAAFGLLTIYHRDFPYFLVPPKHGWLTDHIWAIYSCGALLFLAGACIVARWKLVAVSLGLGIVLLLIFLCWFLPYEIFVSPNSGHYGAWENAAKELALAGGALAIAGRRSGTFIFALTIVSFSIDHFVYGSEAAGYVPSWIPWHVFWIYAAGIALLVFGMGILFRYRLRQSAALLGTMILIWVIILHIPYALAAPLADNGGEVASAFLALGYCGTAFGIAGKKG
jgi:uncharacterized membrane protein